MSQPKQENEERTAQLSYWKEHSAEASFESMMLDSRARELDQSERPEVFHSAFVGGLGNFFAMQILAALGSIANKTVLELGAGIGRFTGELAEDAAHVTACDFMKSLTEENMKSNGHLGNVSFMTEDVTMLQREQNSLDVVFSNWLLMYLSDDEAEKLIRKTLRWLKEGGSLFFRESCYKPAGDAKRNENPTHYRDVVAYFSVLDQVFHRDENEKYYKYKLINCSNLKSYAKLKQHYGQIYWKLVKVEKEPQQVEVRHFLDHVQYTRNGILRYEKLFGHGFVSTGGVETTNIVVDKLDLRSGQLLIDVGCGIGGGDVYLARRFGVDVLGIDLSVNMIAIALERASKGEYDVGSGTVTFEVSDCTNRDVEKASLDVVYSRDTILHIQDKPKLFRRMHEWLKPGGQILITDYCRSVRKASEGFAAYIKQRGYDLHSVAAYGDLLRDAGFVDVVAEDATDSMFLPSLRRELDLAEATREEFLKEFSDSDYAAVVNGWKDKIERATAGEQRWGVFYGRKAL